MLAVALHCDPEIIAQEGWRYGTSSRISTRPKSISGAKCGSLNIQVRLAAMSEGDTGYRGVGGCLAVHWLSRDWAPSWQRDMPRDWWLIGRPRIRCSP